jgi:hypothetical protein
VTHMRELLADASNDEDEGLREAALCYRWALKFHENGLNVVPRNPQKKCPAVKWKGLQDRRVTADDLQDWLMMFAGGVGFITGAISKAVVIESDGPEGEAVISQFEKTNGALPKTFTVRSGSGRGLHRYFRHPGFRVTTRANTQIKLDVKGDGGFCVLPPSLHKRGHRYEIVTSGPPAPLPEGLLEFIEMKAAEANGAIVGKQIGRCSSGLRPSPTKEIELQSNIDPGVFEGPFPSIEMMRAMLEYLAAKNCFEHRNGILTNDFGHIIKVGWIEAGMALKSAYGDAGFELWTITHRDDEARRDAHVQWASFASEAP